MFSVCALGGLRGFRRRNTGEEKKAFHPNTRLSHGSLRDVELRSQSEWRLVSEINTEVLSQKNTVVFSLTNKKKKKDPETAKEERRMLFV